jgi:hypothetical protein
MLAFVYYAIRRGGSAVNGTGAARSSGAHLENGVKGLGGLSYLRARRAARVRGLCTRASAFGARSAADSARH